MSQSITSPRPAATVILVRPAETGFEVYMARRIAAARAFAGAFVFPGGTVQDDDFAPDPFPAAFAPEEAYRALAERGGTPPTEPALARAIFRATVRELFEEAGVLLARDASGRPFRAGSDDVATWQERRGALEAGRLSFSDLLAAGRLTPAYRSLIYFSHWITPTSIPHRFDTRFFVAQLPAGAEPTHTTAELTESLWITPGAALAQADAGSFPMVFPTRMHLARLAALRTLPDLLSFARTKEIHTVLGVREIVNGQEQVDLADEVRECW